MVLDLLLKEDLKPINTSKEIGKSLVEMELDSYFSSITDFVVNNKIIIVSVILIVDFGNLFYCNSDAISTSTVSQMACPYIIEITSSKIDVVSIILNNGDSSYLSEVTQVMVDAFSAAEYERWENA
jgi:hypothetical protein